MSWPVAILAGGLATRMRPLTTDVPKALLPVAGKPFIAHQLTYLKQQGMTKVVLCLGYLGDMIETVVGDGSSWGLQLQCSHDGPSFLGTGGALKKALPLLGEDFFVLYGDSFLPISFKKVGAAYTACPQPALMTVLANHNQWDKSNVWYDKGQLKAYSKTTSLPSMKHIDYGLGLLHASVFQEYPDHERFELAHVYETLAQHQQLAGLEVSQRFYEIGSLQGLKETEDYLKGKDAHELCTTTSQ